MSESTEVVHEATKVTAENEEVVREGRDGVDLKLPSEAARETSNKMHATHCSDPFARA